MSTEMLALPELQRYFDSIDYKKLKLPPICNDAVNSLPSNMPNKFKVFMAVHECCLLASNTNKKILLSKNNVITSNLFSIMLSSSGNNKDMSIRTIRQSFDEAYDLLYEEIYKRSKSIARKKAIKAHGTDAKWRDFMYDLKGALFPSSATGAGQALYMGKLQEIGLGSLNIQVSEMASELKSNGLAFEENIKDMSIAYDMGNLPRKLLKDQENQVQDVHGLNVNYLMFSSPASLFKNQKVREQFKTISETQLARRSMFFYDTSIEQPLKVTSLLEYINEVKDTEHVVEVSKDTLAKRAKMIVEIALKGKSEYITFKTKNKATTLDDLDGKELYTMYKAFCNERALNIPAKFNMYKLSMKHGHWRALKLASLFSTLRGKNEIVFEEVAMAISVVELFINEYKLYDTELNKEPYERIADYCMLHHVQSNPSFKVTKHTLIKEGFVVSTIAEKRLKEIAELCCTYDTNGVYTYINNKIKYKPIGKVNTVVVEEPIEQPIEQQTKPVTVKPVLDEQSIKPTVKVATKPVEVTKKDVKVVEKTVKVSVKLFKNQKGEWLTFDTPKESKEYRQRNSKSGFNNHNVKFGDYARIVANTTSYSPYHFKDGDRSMANVIGTTDVLILDIDKGNMDTSTMHELLKNYRHIIATTSDNTNHFKYRLILQLDRDIELDSVQWKKFYKSVADTIGIEVDTNINKAGMFFGYKDSEVIVNLDGDLFPTKLHLINAYEETEVIEKVKKIKNNREQNIQWDNRYELFEWAYECDKNRSITLYSAMRNACERGWSKELIEELIWEVNSELIRPLETNRVKVTIINQIQKFI